MSMAEACALAGQHDSEPRTEHPDGRRRDHRAIRETWSPKTGPWILGILRSTSVGEQAGRGGTDHRARAGGGWGIADVWRCHCGPERTHSRSVHWLRPVEGRFVPVPATKSRLWLLCYGTQTPVHPLHCADVLRFSGAWKGLPSAPPLMRDSAHPLPGPSTTPTCIARRPGRVAPRPTAEDEGGAERPSGPDSELRRTCSLS